MNILQIGMPVYNGEKFVAQAIESLINQTFQDWQLLISDNCSSDSTYSICEAYTKKDKRITLVRQKENIGALLNFRYLIERAETKYFLWLAADDVIRPTFIEKVLLGFREGKEIGFCFSNIENTDSFGRVIRSYPSFKLFAHDNKHIQILNFILSPEVMGKANLFYSMLNLHSCKEFILNFLERKDLADFDDMVMVFGLLCRTNFNIVDEVLFEKRIVRLNDSEDTINTIDIFNPNINGVILQEDGKLFLQKLQAIANGTAYYDFVSSLVAYRQSLNLDIDDMKKNEEIKIEIINTLNEQINSTLQSVSYRIGRIITYPLRKIKYIFK